MSYVNFLTKSQNGDYFYGNKKQEKKIQIGTKNTDQKNMGSHLKKGTNLGLLYPTRPGPG